MDIDSNMNVAVIKLIIVKNTSRILLRIIPECKNAFGNVSAPVPTIKLNIYINPNLNLKKNLY